MPNGQAPYPTKKSVDAGTADKAKAVQGGFQRTDDSSQNSTRKITYSTGPNMSTLTYNAQPNGDHPAQHSGTYTAVTKTPAR